SVVSGHPPVREVMRREQRRLGRSGAVMEGRDIGSVVFPDAEVKLFLEAHPDERVSRRSRERGSALDVDRSVTARDRLDSRVNPFVPAPGAVAIDTTGRDADDVFAEAVAVVRRALGTEAP